MEVSIHSGCSQFNSTCKILLVGPMGATGSGGGLANLAASLPIPPQAQLVADYIVEAGSSDMGSSGGGFPSGYQSGFCG